MEEKKFWQSTNFYVNTVMVVLGSVLGFSEAMAQELVLAIFGTITVIFNLRNLLKDARFDWLKWVQDSNFWNYLAGAIIAAVPVIPAGLFDALNDALVAAINGNWPAAFIAGVTVFNIVYKLLRPTPAKT